MPGCVVFIPDGNRRFARQRGLASVTMGHSRGRETAERIIEGAFELGARHVVFVAATDLNLMRRPVSEIGHLRMLLKEELRRRLYSERKDTRLYVRGVWRKHLIDPELEELIGMVEGRTHDAGPNSLTILFGHNGLQDVIDATARTTRVGESVPPEAICVFLPTAHVPEVDLIVRTGLENRDYHLSGHLLPFHTRKAYFYHTETLWPDLSKEELARAFDHYETLPKREGA